MQIRIVRASTFHLCDRAFDSDCAPNDILILKIKSVIAIPRKSLVLSGYFGFLPQRMLTGWVGLGLALTASSTVTVLIDQT
jgi:hypothetical protein